MDGGLMTRLDRLLGIVVIAGAFLAGFLARGCTL